MGKKKLINELTNLLTKALRHKIGSIVNKNEIYAAKYAKDSEVFLNEAKKLTNEKNWNSKDKQEIKKQLRLKLEKELKEKDFINDMKFKIMEKEIYNILKEFDLV